MRRHTAALAIASALGALAAGLPAGAPAGPHQPVMGARPQPRAPKFVSAFVHVPQTVHNARRSGGKAKRVRTRKRDLQPRVVGGRLWDGRRNPAVVLARKPRRPA